MVSEAYRVCVVGAGPRGLSVVARLIEGARKAEGAGPDGTNPDGANPGNSAEAGRRRPLEILWVDPYEHGPGHIWQRSQSEQYLMNTPSTFPTATGGVSFEQWRERMREAAEHAAREDSRRSPAHNQPHDPAQSPAQQSDGAAPPLDESLVRELAELGPSGYPSRRLYGHYLLWARHELLGALPDGVTVRLIRGEVTSLTPEEARTPEGVLGPDATQNPSSDWAPNVAPNPAEPRAWVARIAQPGEDGAAHVSTDVPVDATVLAVGHVPAVAGASQAALADAAATRGGLYFGPQVPVDKDWQLIPARETVLIRGMGLNFFDILAQLTLGRGGRFEQASAPEQAAVASDTPAPEPAPAGASDAADTARTFGIAAPSSSPHRAPSLRYVPSGAEPRIVVGSRRGTPYLAKAELEGFFPRRAQLHELSPERVQAFLDEYAASAAAGEPRKLSFARDVWPLLARDVQRNFSENGGEGELDMFALAAPAGLDVFEGPEAHADTLNRLLRRDVARAYRGEEDPVNIAIGTLNKGRFAVKALAAAGVFTDESWHAELRGWFEPLVEALSSGPPAQRIAQLAALVQAGVVRIVGPKPRFEVNSADPETNDSGTADSGTVDSGTVDSDAAAATFRVTSDLVPGAVHTGTALVDAMMPANRVEFSASPLLRQLLEDGLAGVYRWRTGAGEERESSGLDVDPETLRVRDASGAPQPRLYALGLQLSSLRWGTAIAAEAHSEFEPESRALRDADLIAREILGAARASGE